MYMSIICAPTSTPQVKFFVWSAFIVELYCVFSMFALSSLHLFLKFTLTGYLSTAYFVYLNLLSAYMGGVPDLVNFLTKYVQRGSGRLCILIPRHER